MNAKSMLRAGLLTTVLLAAAAAPALAASPAAETAPKPARTCFFLSDWDGWKAPDDKTLYLKVRRDVYRVDLSHGTSQLTSPGVHLVSIVRGGDQVCTPLDLDLRVSDGFGFAMPIMAQSITKLTVEEAKAIPKKYQP
jgi:hypothetical protein